MMCIVSVLKLIAETVAAISTAAVVIVHFFEKPPIKRFFTNTVRVFFGGIKTSAGKRIYFFKAIKERNERLERTQAIIKAVAPNLVDDEILVLDKGKLIQTLYESDVFKKIQVRKPY